MSKLKIWVVVEIEVKWDSSKNILRWGFIVLTSMQSAFIITKKSQGHKLKRLLPQFLSKPRYKVIKEKEQGWIFYSTCSISATFPPLLVLVPTIGQRTWLASFCYEKIHKSKVQHPDAFILSDCIILFGLPPAFHS